APGRNLIAMTGTAADGKVFFPVLREVTGPKAGATGAKVLFVGMAIDSYDDPKQNLAYPVRDVALLRDTFARLFPIGYRSLLLTNRQVSPVVIEPIQRFIAAASPDDLVIVFAAGHGLRRQSTGDYVFALPSTHLLEDDPYGISLSDLMKI